MEATAPAVYRPKPGIARNSPAGRGPPPPRPAPPAAAALVCVQIAWGGFSSNAEFSRLRRVKAILSDVTRTLEAKVPQGDVILAGRELLDHLDFVRRWRLADLSVLRGGRMESRMGRRTEDDADAPSPMQAAKIKRLQEKYSELTPAQRTAAMAGELTTWAKERPIYFVGSKEDLESMGAPFRPEDFRIVASIPIPKEPDAGGRGPDGPPPGFGPPGMMPPGAMPPPDGAPAMPPPDGMPGTPPPGRRDRSPGRRPGFAGRFGRGGGFMGGGRLLNGTEIVVAEWNKHVAPPAATDD